MEDGLQVEKNNHVLHIENMESKTFNDPEYFATFKEYLKVKYQHTDISLILGSDNNAYDFIRKQRQELFPDIPVVFCGVNNFDPKQLEGITNITGVTEYLSTRETVEVILKLHPRTKEIFLLNDHLTTGKAIARVMERDIRSFNKDIKIRYSAHLPVASQMEEIATLKEGTVVLIGAYYVDSDNRFLQHEFLGSLLSAINSVPIYSVASFNIGNGAVGGKVITGFNQGKLMALISGKILAGQKADQVPVVMKETNKFIFDYPLMQKFGIDETLLPEGSTIINRPFSFYQHYKAQIWVISLIFCILLIALFIAIKNYLNAFHAERKLKKAHQKLQHLLDASSLVTLMSTDTEGVITMFNSGAEKMLGYTSQEMLGSKGFEMFHQPDEVDRYGQTLSKIFGKDVSGFEVFVHLAKERGYDEREWTFICKNGRKILINLAVTTIYDDAGVITGFLGIGMDITKRKQAEQELRRSEERYRAVISAIPDLLFQINKQLYFVDCHIGNPEVLLVTPESFLGKHIFESLPADIAEITSQFVEQTLRTKKAMSYQYVLELPDGLHQFESRMVPNGEDEVLSIVRDVTELRKAEKEALEKEQFIRSLLDAVPTPVFFKDKSGVYQGCNRAYTEVLGISTEVIKGKTIYDILPKEYADVYHQKDLDLIARPDYQVFEHKINDKNGKIRLIIMAKDVFRDDHGEIAGIVGSFLDISEIKEQELRQLRNYLSNILDSMPSMIIGVDTSGLVTQWNNTAEKTTGMSAADVHGKLLSIVLPHLYIGLKEIKESIRTRKVQQELKKNRHTAEGVVYEDVTVYPLISDGVEGAVIRIDDVTDMVRLEEMMIQSEKMLSVGGLAAGMAHEINNPLAGMIQTASVMANRLGKSIDIPGNRKAAEKVGTNMGVIKAFMELRGIPEMIHTIMTRVNG